MKTQAEVSRAYRQRHPERVAAQERARLVYKREWARQNYVRPCVECGALKEAHYGRCRACADAERRARRDATWQEIQDLWHCGLTYREIADVLGTSKGTVMQHVVRMRREGWDVPLRPPGGLRAAV